MRVFNSAVYTSQVHASAIPADIREDDSVKCSVLIDTKWVDCSILTLSPLGAHVYFDTYQLQIGKEYEAKLSFRNTQTQVKALVVDDSSRFREKVAYGLKWFQSKYHTGQDRRIRKRFHTSEKYFPTINFLSPSDFSDLVYGKIIDISTDGIKVSTSLRNKFILSGMRFSANLDFPVCGRSQELIEIVYVEIVESGDSKNFVFGAKFVKPSKTTTQISGDYLSLFGNDYPEDLKKGGFEVRGYSKGLSTSYCNNIKDYEAVLKLRAKSYGWFSEEDIEQQFQKMSDEYDTKSRILVMKKNGGVVATCRFSFVGPNEKSEQEHHVEFPKDFPKNHEFIEISRLCVDEKYRGSDIFVSILQRCALLAVQTEKRYILASALPRLAKTYMRIGAFPWNPNITYKLKEIVPDESKLPNSDDHLQILLFCVEDIITGRVIGPLVWAKCRFNEVVDLLIQKKTIDLTLLDIIRLALYRTIAKLFF